MGDSQRRCRDCGQWLRSAALNLCEDCFGAPASRRDPVIWCEACKATKAAVYIAKRPLCSCCAVEALAQQQEQPQRPAREES